MHLAPSPPPASWNSLEAPTGAPEPPPRGGNLCCRHVRVASFPSTAIRRHHGLVHEPQKCYRVTAPSSRSGSPSQAGRERLFQASLSELLMVGWRSTPFRGS